MKQDTNHARKNSTTGRLDVSRSLRLLVRDLPVPAAVLDFEGHAWIWNAAAEQVFPAPPAATAVVRYPLFSIASQPWFSAVRDAVLDGRATEELRWLIRSVGGRHHQLVLNVTPVRDSAGDPAGMLMLMRDCTDEGVQARSRRRRSGWRDELLNAVPYGVLAHRNGRIVYANAIAARILGAAPQTLRGSGIDQVMRMAAGGLVSAATAPARAVVVGSQDERLVDLFPSAVSFRQRKATVLTIREVTRNEDVQLHRSEERLRADTDLAGQGVIMLDAVGYVVGWNAGAESLTGYRADEIIGSDLSAIYPGESLDSDEPSHALKTAITLGTYEEEGWKRRKDGSRFWCQTSINALYDRDRTIEGFAVVLRDLTRQRAGEEAARRTEDQLRQSQRMEAIGRLAGGIAHDFNNLLTAIQGHVQFLLDDLPENHPSQQDALEIRRSADRATALTRQLLAFSRRQELQPRIVNLNDVITDMQTLLRRVISEDIDVLTLLEPKLWSVKADPGQLEQVIMNLAVNARDAMPRGGTISIRTANIDLDERYADAKLEVGVGPYVQLTVSDTGIGMDRETQAHIFEPFFTTKAPGKGTGLGLATVYGIVRQSGGHVWVYSEPGQGTTFKVYLPRATKEGEVLHRAPKLRDRAQTGETVMILEDETSVRLLARRVLEQRGYKVLEAGCGAEAQRVADDFEGPIHLMLSDVVVTDGNGRKIAEGILPARPDMRVLYMSGYTDEDVRQHGVLDSGAHFLEKPFTPDLLARKVREVLDTPD